MTRDEFIQRAAISMLAGRTLQSSEEAIDYLRDYADAVNRVAPFNTDPGPPKNRDGDLEAIGDVATEIAWLRRTLANLEFRPI